MKKKIFASIGLAAGLALMFSLASCGGSKDKGAASSSAAHAEQAPLVDFKLLDHTLLERHEDRPPSVIFPDELKALDNKRISIIGFMAPFEEMDNMKRFMLLPSYVGCFFCSPPSFTQVILVEQKSQGSGKLPFINDAIIVTGTLRLYFKESKHPAHLAEFIYALDDADVTVYTGANAPKRAVGHQQQGGLLSRLQPNATAPLPGAPPHKAFQPQFLVKAVSDERRLPMMQGLKFVGEAPDAVTKRIADHIASLRKPEEWKARERACVALGFADKAFDLPKSIATLEMLRLPGFYDQAAQVIYYNHDLQFSNPDSRLYMVKLITEALIAQNATPPATPPATDDAAFAALALRRGDIERTALLYDQKTRLLAAKPEPLAPGPDVPMLLDKFSGMYNKKALEFVTKVFPPDQLDKLNAAYAKPPTSTAQVLHPEFFTNPSSFHAQPVTWASEELHGAKPLLSGGLGEAALTVWISRFSHDEPTPVGWTGDHFAVWDGGADGDAWIIETHWADATGAEQFFNDTQKLGELMLHARLTDEKKAPDSYVANSDKRTFHSVLRKGRNCVYVYCAKKDAEAAEIESQFVKP
jgi:hypothetical protein